MWRPEEVGVIVAEREFRVVQSGRRPKLARVVFGAPVRAPDPEDEDPWWCPVQFKGAGLDLFRPVAGADSLQALLLAFKFATMHLHPGKGESIEWLGEAERLILAREVLSDGTEALILELMLRLKSVAALLDSGAPDSVSAHRLAIDALTALRRPLRRRAARSQSRTKTKAR